MAPRDALCVMPSFTVAPHGKPGWSKVLTMKMNEKMDNAVNPTKPSLRRARERSAARTRKCYNDESALITANCPYREKAMLSL
jgi:hypothetical protein